ncbi:MAG: hypothetical protein ACPIOQ_42140, partial [Promethearchaeia archaeon]
RRFGGGMESLLNLIVSAAKGKGCVRIADLRRQVFLASGKADSIYGGTTGRPKPDSSVPCTCSNRC